MKREKLKTPSDYEIFSFRSTREEKLAIMRAVDEIVDQKNKNLSAGDKKFRKNDILMAAITRGLSLMKKSK